MDCYGIPADKGHYNFHHNYQSPHGCMDQGWMDHKHMARRRESLFRYNPAMRRTTNLPEHHSRIRSNVHHKNSNILSKLLVQNLLVE